MKHNDSDIENLNSQIEYSKEEKMKVQKTFFFLLVGLVVVMAICLIFLFYSNKIKNMFDKKEEELSKLNKKIYSNKPRFFKVQSDVELKNLKMETVIKAKELYDNSL